MAVALTLALSGCGVSAAAPTAPSVQPRAALHCGSARAALRFYRARFAHWLSLYRYGEPVKLDRIILRCAHARHAAVIWRQKTIEMKGVYLGEFNWRAWLPEKWQRLGACETGGGVRPGNWLHANSQYRSAFGIGSEYDRDAAYRPDYNGRIWGTEKVAVRGWYAHPWPPSPWEQYQAALGHYMRFGGFAGWGCGDA